MESRALSADALASALAGLGPVSGWLMQTGQVHRLHKQAIPAAGSILSAEFHGPGDDGQEQTCWQVIHLGRGQWQLHAHHIRPVPASEANVLGERIRQRHVDGGQLHYYRLWQPDGDDAPQCRIALLTAIEEVAA